MPNTHTTDPNAGTSPQNNGAVDRNAILRGHEIDAYDNMSVFSVPLMVVGFFILAFTTVTIVFYFVSKSEVEPNANPMAVKDNSAPLNARLGRIHRQKNLEKDQPRLEPLREREGDARAITEPETPTGNSPEIHPEDIHVSKKNTPELFQSGPLGHDKTLSKITIDDAMRISLEKDLFPSQKKGTAEPKSTNVPTESNAGRGADDSKADPPKLPDPPVPPKQPVPPVPSKGGGGK